MVGGNRHIAEPKNVQIHDIRRDFARLLPLVASQCFLKPDHTAVVFGLGGRGRDLGLNVLVFLLRDQTLGPFDRFHHVDQRQVRELLLLSALKASSRRG